MCKIALAVSGRGLHPRLVLLATILLGKKKADRRQRGIAALSDANLILPLDHFLQVSITRKVFNLSNCSPKKFIPKSFQGVIFVGKNHSSLIDGMPDS